NQDLPLLEACSGTRKRKPQKQSDQGKYGSTDVADPAIPAVALGTGAPPSRLSAEMITKIYGNNEKNKKGDGKYPYFRCCNHPYPPTPYGFLVVDQSDTEGTFKTSMTCDLAILYAHWSNSGCWE
ncbi:hypothetical protein, partial [Acidithiobacillus sp.]|uniref:hypothetical protein n=1 Tax=Acidithiobacillus sp. TaxID=1872118 RepID=UPI0031FEAF1C